MRRFIIGIMLTCFIPIAYPLDMQSYRAIQIYQKILKANNMSGPQINFEYNSDVNAHAGWGGIYINTGMLADVHNDSEMALVIGHELAHYKLHHMRSTPMNEYAADQQGAYYMSKAGYNICTGAKLIKRFHAPDSATHPASDKRVHALGC